MCARNSQATRASEQTGDDYESQLTHASRGSNAQETARCIHDSAAGVGAAVHLCRRLLDLDGMERGRAMLLFCRSHEAHRDARLVFRAAAEGRPLELRKRLVRGELAGGRERLGEVNGVMMTPLDAAMAGGHDECIKVLEGSTRPSE